MNGTPVLLICLLLTLTHHPCLNPPLPIRIKPSAFMPLDPVYHEKLEGPSKICKICDTRAHVQFLPPKLATSGIPNSL